MGFQRLNDTQKEHHRVKDEALSRCIYGNSKNKKILKRKHQIVRFGDRVFMIDRCLREKGGFGGVYSAYPIDIENDYRIATTKEVKIKIIYHSQRTLQDDLHSHTSQFSRKDRYIIGETQKDRASFSAKAMRIPRPRKEGEVFVYETAIMMSSLQGYNLKQFLDKYKKTLTPRQRVQLCRNVIAACQIAHADGMCYGDIKLSNVMVHPDTLKVTFIDRDGHGRSWDTIAPEDYECYLQKKPNPEPTEEADIYSLAQGLLIPLLTNKPFCRNALMLDNGKLIQVKDMKDFDNHTITPEEKKRLKTKLKGLLDQGEIDELASVLDKMRLAEPKDRFSLENALAVFDKLLSAKLVKTSVAGGFVAEEKEIYQAQKEADYQRQLWTLDQILEDPKYAIPKEIEIPERANSNFALRFLREVSEHAKKNPKKTAAIAVVGCVAVMGVTIFLSGGFAAVPWLAAALVLAKPAILGSGIGIVCSIPFFRRMYHKAVDEHPSPKKLAI